MKFIKNKDFLKIKTNTVDIKHGIKIGNNLLKWTNNFYSELKVESPKIFSSAANEFGLKDRVFVLYNGLNSEGIGEESIFINPVIIEKSTKKVLYYEYCNCLSGRVVKTVRHESITIEYDSLDITGTPIKLKREFKPTQSLSKLTVSSDEYFNDVGLKECILVQQSIDHLDGKLISDSDRNYNLMKESKQDSETPKKYGRNEKVVIEKDGETKYIKYKLIQPLLNDNWKLVHEY